MMKIKKQLCDLEHPLFFKYFIMEILLFSLSATIGNTIVKPAFYFRKQVLSNENICNNTYKQAGRQVLLKLRLQLIMLIINKSQIDNP